MISVSLLSNGPFSAAESLGGVAEPAARTATELPVMETILPLVASLVGILALIGFLAFVAKRFNLPQTMTGQMKTLAMLPLGPKEKLAVVQVGEQQYLIGVGSQGIQLLDKLDPPLDDSRQPEFGALLKGFKARQSDSREGQEEVAVRQEPRFHKGDVGQL